MKKVLVGLSGGIDSAISTIILKEQGFYVECAFMHNWDQNQSSQCTSGEDYKMAMKVADHLNVKLHFIDLSTEYYQEVFLPFLDALQQNLTPNPDILCNKQIKFKHFIAYAKQNNFDYIATGHYAKITKSHKGNHLMQANDKNKDQTYFLSTLNQEQLDSVIFPLCSTDKNKVKEIAQKLNLPNKDQKESMGICFIGQKNFSDFIKPYLLNKPGDIITTKQQIIGQHNGLFFHTIGQRKGLNIGGQSGFLEKCWYVVAKNIKENSLIVSQDPNDSLLYCQQLKSQKITWINQEPDQSKPLKARIRHRQALQNCNIVKNDDYAIIEFDLPQRAVTPGQSIVFYQEDFCLGGALIIDAIQ